MTAPMSFVSAALRRAEDAYSGAKPDLSAAPQRFLVVGDPQSTFAKFASVLERYDALGPDGWLRPDVGLVSLGDHFDFAAPKIDDPEDRARAGREGLRILAWLAAHPPSQTRILLGNHDSARVMELVAFDDARFAEARAEAYALQAAGDAAELRRTYVERFGLPNADVARHDFSTYSTEQRSLVMRLLLDGRFLLSAVARLGTCEVLLTHTGVVAGDLAALELPSNASAPQIHRALASLLDAAVERVRGPWSQGETIPLELGPVHRAAVPNEEAGGFLAHRPANPDRPGIRNPAWECNAERPRRFDPRRLPRGLVQAVGHTPVSTQARELVPWFEGTADVKGPARTLFVEEGSVRVVDGIGPLEVGRTALVSLDPSLHHANVDDVELMVVDAVGNQGD